MKTVHFSNTEHRYSLEEEYLEFFDINSNSFNNPLLADVEDIYNKMISDCSRLTNDQEYILHKIFGQFLYIQVVIDPKRLKDFSYTVNDDNDLILFRNTEDDLINLVIHPEEDFTLSIIGKQKGNRLEYFDNGDADFESIVYDFLK